MSESPQFYLYTLNEQGGNRCYASPLPEDLIFASGLPSEALAGEFTKGKDDTRVENFQQNPVFLKFLHWAIARHIRECPGFRAEAERRQNGQMLVVDTRCFPLEGNVPKDDVVGVVEVKEGIAVGFHGLEEYKVFSDKGFMKIDPWLYEKYLDELTQLVKKSAQK